MSEKLLKTTTTTLPNKIFLEFAFLRIPRYYAIGDLFFEKKKDKIIIYENNLLGVICTYELIVINRYVYKLKRSIRQVQLAKFQSNFTCS
jgi:hypothetical protein